MIWQSQRLCLLLMVGTVGLLGVMPRPVVAEEPNQEFVNMMLDALKSEDAEMRTGAIGIIRDMPGEGLTKALAAELPKLIPTAQVQLLSALADRGHAVALPAVIEASKAENESVRVEALKAIGQLGDVSSVPLLAQRAAESRGIEQKAARDSLYRLRGPEIDATVLQNLASAEPKAKVELVRALGERNIVAGTETLLKTAKDSDRRVRLESFKVLKVVAKPEQLPALVHLVLDLVSASDRTEAEKMVAAVAHKIENRDRQAAAVLAVLPSVKDIPNRASLLRVLGRIGDNSALPTLRTGLGSRESDIQDASIRALSDWPTSEPVPDLLKVAQTSEDRVHRVLALRGFVRLLGLPSDRSDQETIDLYRKAMDLAPNAIEKKRVLSGLAAAESVAALQMVAEYLDDLALYLEAESAAVRIAQAIHGSNPQACKEALEKVLKSTKNDTIREQAQTVIDQIGRFDDYITAWQMSGPYTKEEGQEADLFDVALAPETDGEAAEWKAMPAGTNTASPVLMEFDKALGGNDRVAYARTQVWSPKEQKALLEMGSDDGIKVWLNGELVHANNATRPATPGQDKAAVTLAEGWNTVLVKITQAAGEWAFCARLRSPDGARLEGLKIEAK